MPAMSETLWKCEQFWAGRRFYELIFSSLEEAQEYVSSVLRTEPDQVFSIKAIKAEQLWN